jgi:NADH-quinone oxidoreductase subunit J
MMDAWVVAGLVVIVVSAILAVHLRDLLRAALSLAVLSVVLAALFFKLGAPYAGAFELSVCAGLVTVLFVAAISSVDTRQEGEE